ncbi:MAG TPA: class I SAM-dependent methyltransferase [Opitutaceae bacterium]|nr:class I SAM-dependent methyltransferase [Opitutaceae bacterium]
MPSLEEMIRANRRAMKAREVVFRRHGYDSPASLAFAVGRILPLPGRVLEIGTGRGRFLGALADYVDRLTTLDADAAQQRTARLHVRRSAGGRPIRFVVGDAARLPWSAASFDGVVTMNTFHHLACPLAVLREMMRVLKPGGKLALCDFSPRGFQIFDRIHRAEGRVHPRLEKGLVEFRRHLREAGWRTSHCKGCNQELLIAVAPLAAVRRRTA